MPKKEFIVVNANEIIDKDTFVKRKKRNRMVEVVGECWNSEAGWYDKCLAKCKKDYGDKKYRIIKMQIHTDIIDVGFTAKHFLKNNVRYGKLVGYVLVPSSKYQYIAVMEKPAKERVACEIVKAFFAKHKVLYNEKLTIDEMKNIIQNTLHNSTDINLRLHLNFSRYEDLPLEYQFVGYFPFVVEKGKSIIPVDIDNFYLNVEDAIANTPIEYWVSESSELRKMTKESKMRKGTISENEMLGYLEDSGILSRLFAERNHGRAGKGGIRKDDNIVVNMTNIHKRSYQIPFVVNFSSDAVIETDSLGYSVTVSMNRKMSHYFYLPQVRNNALALENRDIHLSHKLNLAVWYNKDTVYFVFLYFKDLKDFTKCEIVHSIAFTFDKDKANAFHYYSKEGKRQYRKTQDTILQELIQTCS